MTGCLQRWRTKEAAEGEPDLQVRLPHGRDLKK